VRVLTEDWLREDPISTKGKLQDAAKLLLGGGVTGE